MSTELRQAFKIACSINQITMKDALIEEVNKLEWVDINDNFFDMTRYAGEGNIGHIIEEIKIELTK